ncbi:acyl carrier protein [soil metagenome]
MIPIADFIKEIEAEIEEIVAGTLTPETDYRKLESWSSMHALIILALVDTNHDVTLTGEELRTCITVQDLYNLVKAKQG